MSKSCFLSIRTKEKVSQLLINIPLDEKKLQIIPFFKVEGYSLLWNNFAVNTKILIENLERVICDLNKLSEYSRSVCKNYLEDFKTYKTDTIIFDLAALISSNIYEPEYRVTVRPQALNLTSLDLRTIHDSRINDIQTTRKL
ncbi:MAG: hypothetical protein J0H68_02420 [Sphingobacteriia bacterium]|nr:hypothetical protein [Sphingobacteriia bacterium]